MTFCNQLLVLNIYMNLLSFRRLVVRTKFDDKFHVRQVIFLKEEYHKLHLSLDTRLTDFKI